MKNRILSVLAVLAVVLFLFACAEETPENTDKDIIIDAEALANDISKAYGTGEIELISLDSASCDIRYGISGLYSYVYAEASVTVTSDEILVIEASSEENADTIYGLIDTYRMERAELFASYAPGEVPKLEGAFLEKAGRYIVFVASDNVDEAERIWEDYRS